MVKVSAVIRASLASIPPIPSQLISRGYDVTQSHLLTQTSILDLAPIELHHTLGENRLDIGH